MSNPVMRFEIAGRDGEALSKFYSAAFDWNSNPKPSGIYELDPAVDQGIMGHILPTTDDMLSSNFVTVYIQVDDLQASLEKVENLGGKISVPPQVIPGDMGSFAMFVDPSGNTVGLYQAAA